VEIGKNYLKIYSPRIIGGPTIKRTGESKGHNTSKTKTVTKNYKGGAGE